MAFTSFDIFFETQIEDENCQRCLRRLLAIALASLSVTFSTEIKEKEQWSQTGKSFYFSRGKETFFPV